MKNFLQFLNEFNKHDVYKIFQNDDIFTVSYEIELETEDKNIKKIITDIEERKIELDKILTNELETRFGITDSIVGEFDWEYHEDTIMILEDIIEDKKCRKFVIKFYKDNCIKGDILFDKMIIKLKEVLPNYWNKWGSEMEIVKDDSLTLGLEFKHKLYVIGLSKGLEMWNDFWDDYEKQESFKFKKTTGLHINLGILNNKDWNFCKGFIFVKDENKENYVFKGIEDRIKNRFCGTYRKEIYKKLSKFKDISDIYEVEKKINFELYNIVKSEYDRKYKNFGLNFKYLTERNYMEYRYVGGEISRDIVLEKTKYFAYITYLMMDKDYKKMDYYKKLYKFINDKK